MLTPSSLCHGKWGSHTNPLDGLCFERHGRYHCPAHSAYHVLRDLCPPVSVPLHPDVAVRLQIDDAHSRTVLLKEVYQLSPVVLGKVCRVPYKGLSAFFDRIGSNTDDTSNS